MSHHVRPPAPRPGRDPALDMVPGLCPYGRDRAAGTLKRVRQADGVVPTGGTQVTDSFTLHLVQRRTLKIA